MASKQDIKSPIKSELKGFEPYYRRATKTKIPILDIIINYILRRKGKQMRPILVFLSAKLNGEFNEKAYHAAITIELLHTATLLHDDVVDEAHQRRGFFSINAIWKNKLAVLVGDYILAKGLLWSLDHDNYDLLKHISVAVKDMSEGEILQIEKNRKFNVTEETYFEIIKKKTASLLSTSAAVGTCSVTNDEKKISLMRKFGEHAGIAYQIKDDLFDFEKNKLTGKPAGNDIRERKMTLPFIYALSVSKKKEKSSILKTLKKHDKSSEDIDKIIKFVRKKGGMEYAKSMMLLYRNKAIKLLDTYPESKYKTALIEYVNYITSRKK